MLPPLTVCVPSPPLVHSSFDAASPCALGHFFRLQVPRRNVALEWCHVRPCDRRVLVRGACMRHHLPPCVSSYPWPRVGTSMCFMFFNLPILLCFKSLASSAPVLNAFGFWFVVSWRLQAGGRRAALGAGTPRGGAPRERRHLGRHDGARPHPRGALLTSHAHARRDVSGSGHGTARHEGPVAGASPDSHCPPCCACLCLCLCWLPGAAGGSEQPGDTVAVDGCR